MSARRGHPVRVPRQQPPVPAARRPAGSALLIVLWFLVLLAAILTPVALSGRTELRLARNLASGARAEALADAGIARAVFGVQDPSPEARWWPDEIAPRRVELGGGVLLIILRDENALIDLNRAPEPLVAALFQVVGMTPQQSLEMAARITDWIDGDDAPRPLGAERMAYRQAGLPHVPPNAPLESLDELARILGMTPEVLGLVRPHLTVFSDAARPDVRRAGIIVRRAVALATGGADPATARQPGGAQPGGAQAAGAQAAGARPAGSGAGASAPTTPVLRVVSSARMADGAAFTREAVVRLDRSSPRGYVVLEWRRREALP